MATWFYPVKTAFFWYAKEAHPFSRTVKNYNFTSSYHMVLWCAMSFLADAG